MTTDQIVRIILKRVDSIIKWNYSYLDESYEIRKEIYALLNDPVIKAEILNLKKEEVFKNKTEKIEELMEERKKEREILFKKISSAKKEYNNPTTERTVQVNLNDILKEKENTLEEEILSTKEVDNYIKHGGNEKNIKILSEIQNKKRELEIIQTKLLKTSDTKHKAQQIDNITKIFIDLENLFKQLNKEEEKPKEEKESLKEKIQTFIKEKVLHENKEEEPKKVVTHHPKKELDIKYHENMNENPELAEMKNSFKNEVKNEKKLENKEEETPKEKTIKKDNETNNKKIEERNANADEDLVKENTFLKKNLEELKEAIESHRKLKKEFENIDVDDKQIEKEITANKNEHQQNKKEKEQEEEKKEKENTANKKEEIKKSEKTKNKNEAIKENKKIVKENSFIKEFETEVKEMSKDLRKGIRKHHFTKKQYNNLLKKYETLKEIETKKRGDKIKFKFNKEEKKILKNKE